mmetsp:Transcript_4783/g.12853  ORF Transcript_4783/g.12853 Transcript_4783/m.12853 type:complete len:248 (-) Transcript_4783:738-1481(-)
MSLRSTTPACNVSSASPLTSLSRRLRLQRRPWKARLQHSSSRLWQPQRRLLRLLQCRRLRAGCRRSSGHSRPEHTALQLPSCSSTLRRSPGLTEREPRPAPRGARRRSAATARLRQTTRLWSGSRRLRRALAPSSRAPTKARTPAPSPARPRARPRAMPPAWPAARMRPTDRACASRRGGTRRRGAAPCGRAACRAPTSPATTLASSARRGTAASRGTSTARAPSRAARPSSPTSPATSACRCRTSP